MQNYDTVLILDFGAQYISLVAREIRKLGVFCEIVPYNISFDKIRAKNPKAIIFSGSPHCVFGDNSLSISKEYFDLDVPILGICYGMQLISHNLNGKVVTKDDLKEFGKTNLSIIKKHTLLDDIEDNSQVWMSHNDTVVAIPEGFDLLATTNDGKVNCVIANDEKKLYGVQYHPEVQHSVEGSKIFANFVLKIAKCEANWQMNNFVDHAVEKIRSTVGKSNVVLGLSGGVDSSVVASLMHKAIDKQLTCIFVDTGLLRKNEMQEVKSLYEKSLNLNIKYIDAKQRFFSALVNIKDPEEKRKVIGKEFINVFQDAVKNVPNIDFLAQGTVYPDIIESSVNCKSSSTIKSHHNVGGLPKDLNLKVIEPLRCLFKDEVRLLGKELKLPDSIINRHPFPGPGLGIRVVGEVTEEKVTMLQQADGIFLEEIRKADLYTKISQAAVILLPVKSVGVKGDSRSYEYTAVLRAVNTSDFMTADAHRFSYDFLDNVVARIINEVNGINRVLYDFTSKPPATIEWE